MIMGGTGLSDILGVSVDNIQNVYERTAFWVNPYCRFRSEIQLQKGYVFRLVYFKAQNLWNVINRTQLD